MRLSYALEDLVSGDGTILKIAINNGFPNVASFNRELREAYGMTPTEYRTAHQKVKEKTGNEDILKLLVSQEAPQVSSQREIRVNAQKECGEYQRF